MKCPILSTGHWDARTNPIDYSIQEAPMLISISLIVASQVSSLQGKCFRLRQVIHNCSWKLFQSFSTEASANNPGNWSWSRYHRFRPRYLEVTEHKIVKPYHSTRILSWFPTLPSWPKLLGLVNYTSQYLMVHHQFSSQLHINIRYNLYQFRLHLTWSKKTGGILNLVTVDQEVWDYLLHPLLSRTSLAAQPWFFQWTPCGVLRSSFCVEVQHTGPLCYVDL